MPRPYSDDLRECAAALVASGWSCRGTAALFGVSVASVVRWSQCRRMTGTAASLPMGGRHQERSLKPCGDWLLSRLAAVPDMTLRRFVTELGVMTSYGSVWRLVHDEGISFKNVV